MTRNLDFPLTNRLVQAYPIRISDKETRAGFGLSWNRSEARNWGPSPDRKKPCSPLCLLSDRLRMESPRLVPGCTHIQSLTGYTTCENRTSSAEQAAGCSPLGCLTTHSKQNVVFHGSQISHLRKLRTAKLAKIATIESLSRTWKVVQSEPCPTQASPGVPRWPSARVNLSASGDPLPSRAKVPTHRTEHPETLHAGWPAHEGLIHSENCWLLSTASAARERVNWAEATILIALPKTGAYFTPSLGTEPKSHLALGCCLGDQTLRNVGK